MLVFFRNVNVIKCFLRLLRLPLDLCFLTWDFVRSLREAVLRMLHHPTHCSFCEELEAGGRPCQAARKYGNVQVFRLVCPCAQAADSDHAAPWCGLDNSYDRKLKQLPAIGLLILLVWAGLAWAFWPYMPHRSEPAIEAPEDSGPGKAEVSQNKKSHLQRGLAYLASGAHSDARISLLNARDADSSNGEVYHALGRLYMQIGEMENARMSMKLAVRHLPDDMDARRRLAEVYLYHLNYEQALEQLDIVCTRTPEDAAAGMFRVYTLRELGRVEESNRELERVLALSSTPEEVDLQAADLLLGQGQLDRAKALYRRHPEAFKTRIGLIRIHATRGEFEAAEALLKDLPEADSKEAGIVAAELHLLRGRYHEAVALYERLLHDDPRDESLKLKLALLLARMGQSDNAAARAEALMAARDPQNVVGAHALLARLYLDKKLFRQSIQHSDAILRLQKGNPSGLYLKAQALAGQGDKPQALDLLATLDEVRPGHLAGGLLMAALQDPPEAELTYARLTLAHPDSGVPLTFLSVLQFERKDFVTCIVTARKALAIQPKAALAANRLILSLVELGRLEEAWGIVEVLYAGQPQIPYILDAYAWVLFKRGEVSEAANLLKSAAQKSSSPLVLYHAGVALFAEGQKEEGRKHLKVALGIGPSFPFAEEARVLLEHREE
ncbi:MAG: tetratricopeptide (TPR) repeat protein [Candidatus Omnitrophota bacterium]|jgi:tetratricopeptide (TPR) repeat protein